MTKKKQYIIAANWKMYLSFYESVSFCTTNQASITAMAQKHKIIFLPSYIALNAVSNVLQDTGAFHGAQDCSEFDFGAHTGDISASMLTELGCSYCLVGHAERRLHYNETEEQIAKKIHLLLKANITPILCVGPQEDQQNITSVKRILKKQLGILTTIPRTKRFLVAYEPGWMIGKENTQFDAKHIQHVKQIITFISAILGDFRHAKILYGGSVNQSSISNLLNITHLDGFLIGKSSSNFATLQSIVDSI